MEGITYSGLKSMSKAEYLKQFKKPAPWRKASGVLFFAKHKFKNGKANLVAIPFKKYAEAAKCFKNEVKKDNETPYKAKLTLLASFELVKNSRGILTAQITPMQGSLNNDYMESMGKELFANLKMDFNVIGDQDLDGGDLREIAEAEADNQDKISILHPDDAKDEVEKTKANIAKIHTILNSLPKLEAAIGKASPDKLEAKIKDFEKALAQVKKDAKEDNEITTEETADINRISATIERLKEKLANLPKDAANAPDIESDAIIDNLENAELSEEQRQKDALDIKSVEAETSDLLKKNKKKVSKAVNTLKKIKSKIITADIGADDAIKKLTELQGEVAQGINLEVNDEDSMAEIKPIINKINTDIKELQRYVEEKLRPQLQQRDVLEKDLKKVMDETGKNAAVLINELQESVLGDMEAQFPIFESKLNQFYQN